jgi:hypothetical protein
MYRAYDNLSNHPNPRLCFLTHAYMSARLLTHFNQNCLKEMFVSDIRVACKRMPSARTTLHLLLYQQLLLVPCCALVQWSGTRTSNPLSVHSASAFSLTYISVPTSSDVHRLLAGGVPESW